MEITIKKMGAAVVTEIKGVIDSATSLEFENYILDLLGTGMKYFIFDLRGVDYISSAGLRSFLVIAKRAKINAGKISAFGLNETNTEIFITMGFNNFIDIFQTEAEAQAFIARFTAPERV